VEPPTPTTLGAGHPDRVEVELRLALVGLVAIATWSPSTAAAEFMCSGSRCFARESYCEEFRASRHDEGRRAPACRAARRIFCFLATETISGDDITFCSSTMAECRRDLRATQTLNRRLSVNPYSDLSECEEVEWDSDSDGVPNGVDACEHLAGAASARGCPDADGDGAANFSDHCPDIAGSVAGCPDADSDGVGDPDDACPDVAGTLITAGCPLPDGDADGVPDADDRCPAAAGTEGTDGCPDADGDHLEDSLDLCPDVAIDRKSVV